MNKIIVLDEVEEKNNHSETMRLLITDNGESVSSAYGANSVYNGLAKLGRNPGYTLRNRGDSILSKYAAGAFSLLPVNYIPKLMPNKSGTDICTSADSYLKTESMENGVMDLTMINQNNCNSREDTSLSDMANSQYLHGLHEGLSRDSSHCIAETFVDRMESLNRTKETFLMLIEKAVGSLESNNTSTCKKSTCSFESEDLIKSDDNLKQGSLTDVNYKERKEKDYKSNYNNMNNKDNKFKINKKYSIVHTSNYTDLNQYMLKKQISNINYNNNEANKTKTYKNTSFDNNKLTTLNAPNLSEYNSSVDIIKKIPDDISNANKKTFLSSIENPPIITKNDISSPIFEVDSKYTSSVINSNLDSNLSKSKSQDQKQKNAPKLYFSAKLKNSITNNKTEKHIRTSVISNPS